MKYLPCIRINVFLVLYVLIVIMKSKLYLIRQFTIRHDTQNHNLVSYSYMARTENQAEYNSCKVAL